MWPDWGEVINSLINRAKLTAKHYVENAVKNVVSAVKQKVANLGKSVSLYGKIDGKLTLGNRAAANLKKNVGVDIIAISVTLLSGSYENTNHGKVPDNEANAQNKQQQVENTT